MKTIRWHRVTRLFLPCLLIPLAALSSVSADVDLAAVHEWDIVTAKGPPIPENYASTELQDHFGRATGIRIPIVDEVEGPDWHIYVGESEAMRASPVGFSTAEFGPEQLRIVVGAKHIAIAGGAPRGTLYGIYTFLEEHVGVRFLTPEHTHYPEPRAAHPIDAGTLDFDPPFSFRWSYYGEVLRNPDFAARVRCNTILGDERYGGTTGRILINHTFGRQIPSKTYGKDHPEYYCEIDGQRRANVENDWHDNEPCLTNPDVLRIVTDAVMKHIAENPKQTNVAVSQNDNDKYCRCGPCSAIDKREGTQMGSLLTFVNAVADRVAERHPEIKVGTLAYWYTRQAPARLKPRPNVQIQLCSIECSMFQPLDDPDCDLNVAFCRDFRKWSQICDDIAIWNYNTNFRNYLLPCPNLRAIEPNIRFFRDRGVKAVFMQAAGNAVGAEFAGLRNYIISGLLWDPTRSGRNLMDEFLVLHYRSAAPPIRRFIDLVHDNAERKGVTDNCFANAADYGIDDEIVAAGFEAFDKAMRLADDVEVRRRVESASICVHRAAMEDAWLHVLEHWDDPSPPLLTKAVATRTRPHTRRLIDLCIRHGVDRWKETLRIEEAVRRLRRVYGLKPGEPF